MKYFRNIEGLRGWLAWLVVLLHVTFFTGADLKWPLIEKLEICGVNAVYLFVIISGFVITHLLLEKQEKYIPYIARRVLRIYPIYLVCLALGIGATYLNFRAFADHPWGDLVPAPGMFADELNSLSHGDFLRHLAAHLTLLNGAISNRVLPASPYMFLVPGWTISLEWQFYLVAPLILMCLRTSTGQMLVAMATVAAYLAYEEGWIGQFFEPSFLPGAALYFAVGIATRMLFAEIPEFKRYPLALVIIAFGFCAASFKLLPFIAWAAFIVWLRTAEATTKTGKLVDSMANAAFNSKVARYLGARSYSTYLIHEPIIHTIVFVCIKRFGLQLGATLIVTYVTTIPLTLIASAVLYRMVEAPAIAFGKRVFAGNVPVDRVEAAEA